MITRLLLLRHTDLEAYRHKQANLWTFFILRNRAIVPGRSHPVFDRTPTGPQLPQKLKLCR